MRRLGGRLARMERYPTLLLGSAVACALGSTAAWWRGHTAGREARELSSSRVCTSVNDLTSLAWPVIVAIVGTAVSREPITCQLSSARGVIYEQTAEQLFLKQASAEQRTVLCVIILQW